MNCKPGDLAYVIKEDADCKANIGHIVEVKHLCAEGQWEIEPTSGDFLVRDLFGGVVHRYADRAWGWVSIPDDYLRPIRDPGDYAQDESFRWAPAPEKVTV